MNLRNTTSTVILAAIAGFAFATASSKAGDISISTTAPTADAMDVSNYETPTATQKWFHDVEHDAGQTFTPTADGFLQSFTVYLSSKNENDAGNENVDIRFGTISRPGEVFTFTDVYSENAVMAPSPEGDWAADDYITFTFETPQAVSAGVEYGVITDAQEMGGWQQGGIPYRHRTRNTYAGGVMINRGGESANADLVFHADIVATIVGDIPLTLAITSVTSPSIGFDLTWPTQDGRLYRIWSTADLSEAPADWDLIEGDIAASGTGTNSKNVTPVEPVLFYAVEEYPTP